LRTCRFDFFDFSLLTTRIQASTQTAGLAAHSKMLSFGSQSLVLRWVSVPVSVAFSESCAHLRRGYSEIGRIEAQQTRKNTGDLRCPVRRFRVFRFGAKCPEKEPNIDSGSSAGNGVEVRILYWAPTTYGFFDLSKFAFVTYAVRPTAHTCGYCHPSTVAFSRLLSAPDCVRTRVIRWNDPCSLQSPVVIGNYRFAC
jgi:hypothetical protein